MPKGLRLNASSKATSKAAVARSASSQMKPWTEAACMAVKMSGWEAACGEAVDDIVI